MLQLRQLDLQLAFPRPRALRKNIQNQRSPIQYLAIENSLQVTALRRRKFIIEDHRVNVRPPAMLRELIRLSFANEGRRTGSSQFLQTIADHLPASSGR